MCLDASGQAPSSVCQVFLLQAQALEKLRPSQRAELFNADPDSEVIHS